MNIACKLINEDLLFKFNTKNTAQFHFVNSNKSIVN